MEAAAGLLAEVPGFDEIDEDPRRGEPLFAEAVAVSVYAAMVQEGPAVSRSRSPARIHVHALIGSSTTSDAASRSAAVFVVAGFTMIVTLRRAVSLLNTLSQTASSCSVRSILSGVATVRA